MNKELVYGEIDEKKLDVSRISHEELKALFNLMNGKPDSMLRIFPRDVNVEIKDLYSLHEKIKEKLQHYIVAALIVNISVKFDNNTFKEFSDWIEFQNCNWSSFHYLENITIKYDFFVDFKEYGVPQRHTLVIRLSSGMKPQQILQLIVSGQIEEIDSIDKSLSPVTCKVDFTNHLLGDELINIIEEWDKSIQKVVSESGKTMKFIRKYRKGISAVIENIIPLFGLIVLVSIVNFNLSHFNIDTLVQLSISHIQKLIMLTLLFSLIYKVIKNIGEFLSNKFLTEIYEYGDTHIFNITNGDKIKREKLDIKNKKHEKGIKSSLSLTILINVICGIVATYICTIF